MKMLEVDYRMLRLAMFPEKGFTDACLGFLDPGNAQIELLDYGVEIDDDLTEHSHKDLLGLYVSDRRPTANQHDSGDQDTWIQIPQYCVPPASPCKCGQPVVRFFDYCPRCGAILDHDSDRELRPLMQAFVERVGMSIRI